MAEGGRDILCDWCLQDNENVSATRYCFECTHKLCSLCVTSHGKCKPLINHKLTKIDGNGFNTESIKLVRSLLKCPNHPLEIVKYVCKDHDKVCCNACAIGTHRNCDRLVPLPAVASKRTTEPDIIIPSISLKWSEKVANELLQCENNNPDIIGDSQQRVKQELSEVKRKLDAAFYALEQRILDKIEQQGEFLVNECTANCNKIERVSDKITAAKRDAKFIANADDPVLSYMFDRQQSFQEYLIESDLLELNNTTKARDILLLKLKSADEICQTIAENFKVGIVLRTPTLSLEQPEPEPDFNIQRIAKLKCEITVSDTDWDIRSCVWLGNHIILANCLRKELVVFDIQTQEIVCTYRCYGKPWSITVIDDASIAVCYNANFIDIFSIEHNQLINQQKLKTEMCITAASMNWDENELVCVSTTEGSIIVVSLNEQSVHCLHVDITFRDDLRTALNIVYDNNMGQIHVTCYLKNTVLSFERDEKWNIVKIILSGLIEIHGPWGINVDIDSNVYIVTDNGSVEQYDRNLQFVRQLVEKDEDRDNTWCLAFNDAMTKFALSGYGFVKVFNFR